MSIYLNLLNINIDFFQKNNNKTCKQRNSFDIFNL